MPQVRVRGMAGVLCTSLAVAAVLASSNVASLAQSTSSAPKTTQTVQPSGGGSTPGIVFFDVTSDTITTIRTAQNIVTRVALPSEAKEAVCGDLFDAASNTGSFVITRTGNDVFIKPVASKGQTNLFIKTDREVYNFDLLVVPSAQAYRVVNINLPQYMQQVEALKVAGRREIADERARMQTEMDDKLRDRQRDLEQQNADTLSAEQRKLRAEADRKSGDLATRRFVDGIMQGFPTVPLRERKGTFDQVDVLLDDNAYIFEGKLYVRYRITNNSLKDIVYTEPKLAVRTTESDRPVASSTFTGRGDYKVPAGQNTAGVVVFERPTLERGERLVITVRGESKDRVVTLRLLEQT